MTRLHVYTTNGINPDEVFEGTARQIYYTGMHILRRKRFYGFDIPHMWCSNVKIHCALSQKRMQLYCQDLKGLVPAYVVKQIY